MSGFLKLILALLLLTFYSCIDEPSEPNIDQITPTQPTLNQPGGPRSNGPNNGQGEGQGQPNDQEDTDGETSDQSDDGNENNTGVPFLDQTLSNTIDLTNLPNYANQAIPGYIIKDNSAGC